MNAVGTSRDFRSLPAKAAALKPAARSMPQPKIAPSEFTPPDNSAKAALSTFSFKSASTSTIAAESKTLDRSEETRLEESPSEQNPEAPEDLNELFDKYQALDDSKEEPPDPEEQRHYQAQRLEILEGQYRCRLLLVEKVLERLSAADQQLKQWCDNAPIHPQYQTIQSF